ncbi:MAG: hypothetical protein H6619_01195 [Deltaproteobacteria bacterium]|nr:hypothetical protein [Deltaproteobacteria bacterium]
MNLRLKLVLACLAFLWTNFAFSQEPDDTIFTHPKYDFTVELPENFMLSQDPIPEVAVIVQKIPDKFPIFNVIPQAKSMPIRTISQEAWAEKVLADYKKAGITGAEILSTEMVKTKIGDLLTANVKYLLGDNDLIASVSLVSTKNKHFILTYMDKFEDYDQQLDYRKNFLNSFTVPGQISYEEAKKWPSWAYAFLILGILGLVLFMHVQRKKRLRRN